jgi:hypothetical protein
VSEVLHRSHGHLKRRVPMPATGLDVEALLALPVAQPIIARIGAATDPDYPERAEHVARVAAVAVKAKLSPTNPYARPTL